MCQLLRFGLIVLILVGEVWAALHLWPREEHGTSENCDRVPPGMTRAEVYEFLGEPTWRADCGVGVPPGEEPPELWDGAGGRIVVVFDLKERVVRARYWPK